MTSFRKEQQAAHVHRTPDEPGVRRDASVKGGPCHDPGAWRESSRTKGPVQYLLKAPEDEKISPRPKGSKQLGAWEPHPSW